MKKKQTKQNNIFLVTGLIGVVLLTLAVFIDPNDFSLMDKFNFSFFDLLGYVFIILLVWSVFLLFHIAEQFDSKTFEPVYDRLDEIKAEIKHAECIQAEYADELQALTRSYDCGSINSLEYKFKRAEIYARNK